MPSIIVPPALPWNWMTQRTQHFMRNLATKGYNVYYEEAENNDNPLMGIQEVNPNLYICHGVRSQDFSPPSPQLLWITFPFQVKLISTYRPDAVIYDAADLPAEEFKQWSNSLPLLLKRADLVFASSQIIYQTLTPLHPHVYLVRNGVDYPHFSERKECPSELIGLKKSETSLIGYSGAIAPWLDWSLLDELCTYFNDIQFVFIGALVGLRHFPLNRENVIYLGLQPYESLPAFIQQFLVGLIPFKLTEMTKGCNPIKLYEYCAAGIRILSTPLPEVQSISGIDTANDSLSFIHTLKELLQDPQRNREIRQQFALLNDWRKRSDLINNILKFHLKETLEGLNE